MNPTRWRRVNEIFHAALERDPNHRAAFVHEAAGGDAALEHEVRTLLASHERTQEFLDKPAYAVAADLLIEDPEPSLVGRQIGSYRVLSEIGRGGMGVVYAAEDVRLGRSVAIKALPQEYAADAARRLRLTREAVAAAKVSHRAIATVFELLDVDGDLYIVSELVRGETLRDELQRGPLAPSALLDTLIEVASGLAAAHEQNVIHRDLKPENVVRSASGEIKVLDFGLALLGDTQDATTAQRLTVPGTAPGTPGYMAPEQLTGGHIDGRADVFAFGALAWELACGEALFGTNAGLAMARILELKTRPLTLSHPLPIPGLARIVRRCVHASPEERYPSMQALLSDLEDLKREFDRGSDVWSEERDPRLWWWQFHQGTVASVVALTPVLSWMVRQWVGRFGALAFFVVLALATTAVTLRLNMLFTSRVHPSLLAAHRARLFPWIAAAEAGIAVVLLASAAAIAGSHEATAGLLVGIAIITIASVAIIEPATTRGAGLKNGKW